MAGHPLDRSLAPVEIVDAPETNADLTMCLQAEQDGANRVIGAPPTARVGCFGEVAAERGDPMTGAYGERLRPTRMRLPLGSVSANSCMPQGMSSIGVTDNPAAVSRACHASVSSVMM
jgi:hypothetical protein